MVETQPGQIGKGIGHYAPERKLADQSLIDVLQDAQHDGRSYGEEREKGIELAVRIQEKFD
ncbi:hypothetical protein N4G40_18905 [Pantoea eucrina]|uniref:Uncharacterized protein n=1 Tax=Pantoea eucrina TaxID=472693 RepID=A0ABU5LKR9_9GAMM|nr:hypothetical protein [Pantoea eucrina]MDZ7280326.1 hypothetical protein [Pantoea eucrina]